MISQKQIVIERGNMENLRSNNMKSGMQQAPSRSLLNAVGMTPEEMRKPIIGIVSSFNEIVPGHINLDKISDAVKLGVAEAGGMPVVFPAIAVCDGIAMGHIGMKYSLCSRDLIADSTETVAMAHQFDALVMIPNCDKTVPGMLMAAARLNIPTVFVSGGPMLSGRVKGKNTSLSSMFEAVGAYAAGKIVRHLNLTDPGLVHQGSGWPLSASSCASSPEERPYRERATPPERHQAHPARTHAPRELRRDVPGAQPGGAGSRPPQ